LILRNSLRSLFCFQECQRKENTHEQKADRYPREIYQAALRDKLRNI
jgi:hypothetical protein